MTIEHIKNQIPDYAKDIRLNISQVLSAETALDLQQKQIYQIALGVAYTLKQPALIQAILTDASDLLSDNDNQAAKSAASIMAMNNVYYRFIHLSSDKSYATLPARLRMNVIGNPGIDKLAFELMCLAISAVNGCGMCMDAHAEVLKKAGVSQLSIQSAVKIAAVFNAVATTMAIAA